MLPPNGYSADVLFTRSISVDARPETVWNVVTDVESWPQITDSISSLDYIEGSTLTVGSRVAIKQPRLPRTVWRVTEVADGSRFVWVAEGPGVTTTAGHEITAATPVDLTVWLEQKGPVGAVVGWLGRSLTRRYLEMESTGIKRKAEEQAAHGG